LSYISRVEGQVVGRLVQLIESTRGQEEQGRGGEGHHRMGITRRAEDFPLMISQYGLSSALTFFLSKVGRDDSELLDYGVDYFKGPVVNIDQKVREKLASDAGEEGKGYVSYLALVLVWPLGEAMAGAGLNGVVNGLKLSGSDHVRGAAGLLLRNLQGIQERELLLEVAAMPGLLELKKITRALGR